MWAKFWITLLSSSCERGKSPAARLRISMQTFTATDNVHSALVSEPIDSYRSTKVQQFNMTDLNDHECLGRNASVKQSFVNDCLEQFMNLFSKPSNLANHYILILHQKLRKQ
jgi:hypothetical protein